MISDTRREHRTDLITFLFHDVLCARCINTSSTRSSNQRLSPNFCCHAGLRAQPAVQFSATVQFSTTVQSSDYLDSKKSTATKRTNKASHIFTGNYHSTESFLSLPIPTLAQNYNKDYLVNFPTNIFDLNTLLEPR